MSGSASRTFFDNVWDEIALTLACSEEIYGFRTRDLERRPCAYVPSRSTPT